MLNFTLGQPVNVLFGEGSIKQLGELVKSAGYTKPLVVYDAGVKGAGIVDKAIDSLKEAGIGFATYDKVQSDPPLSQIEAGYEFCVKEKCDSIIGIGGGSSIDTAKGINILRFNPGPLLQYTVLGSQMNRCLGLMVIPTTAGTGSEMSDGVIVTEPGGAKMAILNSMDSAEYAIIDPALYVGMPPDLTRMTGVDVVAHAAESHMTLKSNLATSIISEKVLEIAVEWLPVAVNDGTNMEARSYMAAAASLGGWALNMCGALAGHSFAHVLGAKFKLPHGAACGYALPHVLEYNAKLVPAKVKRIGSIIGVNYKGNETPEEIGAKARDAAFDFINNKVGLKPIAAYNAHIDKSLIPEVAKDIAGELCMGLNPSPMKIDEIIGYLEKILA
ncbi:MAG: iron-containing alcohol dehydrogenase [Treponema sp.]|nr:iron-containing alcohol dehydrogenase [Treponema sp.]